MTHAVTPKQGEVQGMVMPATGFPCSQRARSALGGAWTVFCNRQRRKVETNKSQLGCQDSDGLDTVSRQLPQPSGAAGTAEGGQAAPPGCREVAAEAGTHFPPMLLEPEPSSQTWAQAEAADGRRWCPQTGGTSRTTCVCSFPGCSHSLAINYLCLLRNRNLWSPAISSVCLHRSTDSLGSTGSLLQLFPLIQLSSPSSD